MRFDFRSLQINESELMARVNEGQKIDAFTPAITLFNLLIYI